MNNWANRITALRIIFSILMVMTVPFKLIFWICYLCAGVSDILDGWVARKLKLESDFGAKLDSIADVAFGISILSVVIANIDLPVWLWRGAGVIAIIKLLSLAIGWYKYHTFCWVHTLMSKLTGLLLFCFPLLYIFLKLNMAGGIICVIAFAASIEELFITITSKQLNRVRKFYYRP